MKIDHLKIHRDILKRLNEINKPQEYLAEKLGISRATLWRLNQEKEISMTNFLKILTWLDKGIIPYIKFEK